MQALFYSLSLSGAQVARLVAGFAEPEDLVKFPEEDGGDVDQALAVPFLAGMDAIVVTEARIVLRAYPQDLDIERYTHSANAQGGVSLSLPDPARLRKVEINSDFTPPPPAGSKPPRVVVRAPGAGGVPLFATGAFASPGPMFPAPLGGMTVDDLGGGRRLLTLPSVLGKAWVIQLASGTGTNDLTPLARPVSVERVVLEALPRNLAVVLAPDAGALMLWQNPDVLPPESGAQEISFAPLAQKHLTAALASAASGDATLPVPLRFHSDSGGAVEIVTRSLVAEYQVNAVGAEPITLALRGDFTKLVLAAPATLRPARSALKITAKLLGRELNAASPEPTLVPPSAGLRVGVERWVAAASNVAPRAPAAPGSVVEVASVRVFVACAAAVEAVLELRTDVAGSPGEVAAAPLVAQLAAGTYGWQELELPVPLKVVSGNAPIWLALRTNKGELHWFANPAPSTPPSAGSRVSIDRGATWGLPNPELGPAAEQLLQLFHVSADPPPPPRVRLQRSATVVVDDLLRAAQAKSPVEYTAETALPAAVHAVLAAQPGEGKADTELLLFSRSALDLVVESLTLSYDPFTARAG